MTDETIQEMNNDIPFNGPADDAKPADSKAWKPVTEADLSEVAADMPQAIPDAIEAAKNKDAQEAGQVKDPKGRVFDPSIHQAGPDGQPLLTPTGRFRMKMRLPKTGGINMPEMALPGQDYSLVAKTLVGLFIQTGYALVGDEWLPEKSKDMDEQANLEAATAAYCASTGFKDLPPGLVVAVAFVGYGLRRFGKPRTRSLIEKATAWAMNSLSNFWLWITGKKIRVVPVKDKNEV